MLDRLQKLDWNKWMNNTIVFFTPLALLYLTYVQVAITKDGFQTSDLYPTTEVIGGGMLYLINVALDFFKKYKAN
jgi:hypothetical protein